MSKPDHPTTDKATANLIVALDEFLSTKFPNPSDDSTVRMLDIQFREIGFKYEYRNEMTHRFTVDVDNDWWLTMGSNGPLTITDDPEWRKPHLKRADYVDAWLEKSKTEPCAECEAGYSKERNARCETAVSSLVNPFDGSEAIENGKPVSV